MDEMSPEIAAKLARLLPRLASDAPGEVAATAAAVTRTLQKAGADWHALAARLTESPCPARPEAPARAPRDDGDALAIAQWLRAHAAGRLTPRQRDFVATAADLLTAGRALSPKQDGWLRGLYAKHAGGAQ